MPDPGPLAGLLTIRQAATWCEVSRQHVYTLVERGELDLVRVDDRPFISIESADRYRAAREHRPALSESAEAHLARRERVS